jgi:hypothetical protein
MTDQTSEAKFLGKAYQTFITQHLNHLKTNDKSHIHPPPAFTILYNTLLEDMSSVADSEELTGVEVVLAMDLVMRFGIYLQKHKIDYADFSPCECVVLDDKELDEILKSGS